MFGAPSGNGLSLRSQQPGFTGGFGAWYNNLMATPAQNTMALGQIGAAGYGLDDENTRKAAYSAYLGRAANDPFSARSNWLLRNEQRLNRILDALQLNNPSLRMPEFLTGINPESMYRSASAEEAGRYPEYRRVRFN